MNSFRTLDLLEAGLTLEIEGERVAQIDVPSGFVPYTFAPLLGTHLLLSGDKLKNGMIVVLEGDYFRGNPNILSPEYADRKQGYVPSEYDRARVEENARWAVVTDLQIVRNGPDSRLAKFTALYADGTMRDRKFNVDFKWAVLREFRMAVVCEKCGLVHPEEEASNGAPFGVDLDAMTRRVTSDLLGTDLNFEEFSEKIKDDSFVEELVDSIMGKVATSFLGGILEDLEDDIKDEAADETAEDVDNERQPGETEDEYLERLRDAEEARNEYSSNEALRVLRDKLMVPPNQQ